MWRPWCLQVAIWCLVFWRHNGQPHGIWWYSRVKFAESLLLLHFFLKPFHFFHFFSMKASSHFESNSKLPRWHIWGRAWLRWHSRCLSKGITRILEKLIYTLAKLNARHYIYYSRGNVIKWVLYWNRNIKWRHSWSSKKDALRNFQKMTNNTIALLRIASGAAVHEC